jgi:four helix bundle protein
LVRRFEDLVAWQEARRLTESAYRVTRAAPFARDHELADQLRRAAISTVTNIAEGFGSGTRAEFKRFLRYAIRSATEVQSCLYVAADQRYLSELEFEQLYGASERLKSLCSALVRRLGVTRMPTPPDGGRVAERPGVWVVRHRSVDTSARQHVSTSALTLATSR